MDSMLCLHPPLAPGGPPWAQGTFAWLCHRFFQIVISGQRQGRVSLERVCGSSCTSQCFSLSWGHFLDRHLLPLTSVRCNLATTLLICIAPRENHQAPMHPSQFLHLLIESLATVIVIAQLFGAMGSQRVTLMNLLHSRCPSPCP